MARIVCIEDVVMVTGHMKDKVSFTKGHVYSTYPYLIKDNYSIQKVICAKNDLRMRHILVREDTTFFDRHFRVVKKGENPNAIPTV
jgi:choline kinase